MTYDLDDQPREDERGRLFGQRQNQAEHHQPGRGHESEFSARVVQQK